MPPPTVGLCRDGDASPPFALPSTAQMEAAVANAANLLAAVQASMPNLSTAAVVTGVAAQLAAKSADAAVAGIQAGAAAPKDSGPAQARADRSNSPGVGARQWMNAFVATFTAWVFVLSKLAPPGPATSSKPRFEQGQPAPPLDAAEGSGVANDPALQAALATATMADTCSEAPARAARPRSDAPRLPLLFSDDVDPEVSLQAYSLTSYAQTLTFSSMLASTGTFSWNTAPARSRSSQEDGKEKDAADMAEQERLLRQRTRRA